MKYFNVSVPFEFVKESDSPTLHCAPNAFKNSDYSKITGADHLKITNRRETIKSEWHIFVRSDLLPAFTSR